MMKTEDKYVVSIKQLADIVRYCVRMTVAGGDCRKDWTNNVLEAINESKTRTIVLIDKIKLKKIIK